MWKPWKIICLIKYSSICIVMLRKVKTTHFKLICIWPFEIHKIKDISVAIDISLWEISSWFLGPRGFWFVAMSFVLEWGKGSGHYYRDKMSWCAWWRQRCQEGCFSFLLSWIIRRISLVSKSSFFHKTNRSREF